MKIEFISEPELEFAYGEKHISIKYGLKNFGPLDYENTREIRLGLIGTNETVEKFSDWITKLEYFIPSKSSSLSNHFIDFPGIGIDSNLKATIKIEENNIAIINTRQIEKICKNEKKDEVIRNSVDLFIESIAHLNETKKVDVFVCLPPEELRRRVKEGFIPKNEESVESEVPDPGSDNESISIDFHDRLKALGFQFDNPIQLIWPYTYNFVKKIDGKKFNKKGLEDEATRAWNLYTALYYKSGGVPWRLQRVNTEYTTCYVGIGFYMSLDRKVSYSSIAQIFNERGEGIITQGGKAEKSDDDRQLHISENDAFKLLDSSLLKYRKEHKAPPARIVLHKTSFFNQDEINGFERAIEKHQIEFLDLVYISKSFTRLFRIGEDPPLRGTYLNLDENNNLLYTFGSIDFYGGYPGLYVPKPLFFSSQVRSQSNKSIAEEILKLTKMNWNDTRMTHSLPITISACRKVGTLLKYLKGTNIQEKSGFRFYM